MKSIWPCFVLGIFGLASPGLADEPPSSAGLAAEVHDHGWIAFSAQTSAGDWDLFVMRPDGSDRRGLTDTREFNEAGVRYSPDGRRLLYYRMPKRDAVDNNTYGTFELVIAEADGRKPVSYGRDFPWASWGPDGRQFACLTPKGICLVDVASRQVVRTLPRRGIVQQLVWSPDGQSFAGTANGLGEYWNIGCLGLEAGALTGVSETERYNCTPDWHPDKRHLLYARGTVPKQNTRAQLWVASSDGRDRRMLYAEGARHIYGACASPDGKYLLFTRSVGDLGAVGRSQTTMALVRWADTPMLGDNDPALRAQYPKARLATRLDLGAGWEPHWTLSQEAGP